MPASLDTSSYARVVIIDTQVVLETQPMDQLPWQELGSGPLLLLVCRQVQSEIDAKKNDGRLGRRARDFNKLLDMFLETRTPAALHVGSPRVDVALVANRRVDWSSLDNLDPDDGDDKVVAQALNALVDDRTRLELLSHDMRPRDAAITHGLRAIKLPEHWLRAVEPSPDQRERTRLENELRVLRSDQPELAVRLENLTPEPWTSATVKPASPEQTETIKTAILRAAPRQEPRDSLGLSPLGRDYSFDDRHRKWRDRLLANDLPNMHCGLERLHAQKRIEVIVENIGAITAEGLSLEIRSGNVVLHSLPYYVLVFGRPAPYPRPFHDPMRHMNFDHLRSESRHEPFTFYLEEEGPGSTVIWSCTSFRQEKSFHVELSVEVTPSTGSKAQIEAVVTARNMKGDKRAQLVVPVKKRVFRFEEAADPSTRRLVANLAFDPLESVRRDDDLRWLRNDGSAVKMD